MLEQFLEDSLSIIDKSYQDQQETLENINDKLDQLEPEEETTEQNPLEVLNDINSNMLASIDLNREQINALNMMPETISDALEDFSNDEVMEEVREQIQNQTPVLDKISDVLENLQFPESEIIRETQNQQIQNLEQIYNQGGDVVNLLNEEVNVQNQLLERFQSIEQIQNDINNTDVTNIQEDIYESISNLTQSTQDNSVIENQNLERIINVQENQLQAIQNLENINNQGDILTERIENQGDMFQETVNNLSNEFFNTISNLNQTFDRFDQTIQTNFNPVNLVNEIDERFDNTENINLIENLENSLSSIGDDLSQTITDKTRETIENNTIQTNEISPETISEKFVESIQSEQINFTPEPQRERESVSDIVRETVREVQTQSVQLQSDAENQTAPREIYNQINIHTEELTNTMQIILETLQAQNEISNEILRALKRKKFLDPPIHY